MTERQIPRSEAEHETSYRSGYCHGYQHALQAVLENCSEETRPNVEKLEQWVATELRQWRLGQKVHKLPPTAKI